MLDGVRAGTRHGDQSLRSLRSLLRAAEAELGGRLLNARRVLLVLEGTRYKLGMLLIKDALTHARAELGVAVVLVLVLGVVATGTRRVLHVPLGLERATMIQLRSHTELQRGLGMEVGLVGSRSGRNRAILLLLMIDDTHRVARTLDSSVLDRVCARTERLGRLLYGQWGSHT